MKSYLLIVKRRWEHTPADKDHLSQFEIMDYTEALERFATECKIQAGVSARLCCDITIFLRWGDEEEIAFFSCFTKLKEVPNGQ